MSKDKQNYAEKYKDPRWQKKRLEILERDEWECQKCGDKESTLHVHHRYYEPNTDPWDYQNQVLVTLCNNCHEEEHDSTIYQSNILFDAIRYNFFSSDIDDIISAFENIRMPDYSEVTADMIMYIFNSKEIMNELKNKFFAHLRKNGLEPAEYFKKVKNTNGVV